MSQLKDNNPLLRPSFANPWFASTKALAILIGLITLLIFHGIISHDFLHFDDNIYVFSNPHIQNGLSLETFKWAFTTFHSANYHPLTWLTHILDVQFYGLNPAGHHLTNGLLHAANTMAVFLMLFKLTGCRYRSAMVAALFGWHPLHVESVAWVAERKDLLCGLFFILTLSAYQYYTEKSNIYRYSAVFFALAFALLSKPMAVTLPFVLLLLDGWPLHRLQAREGGWRAQSKLLLKRVIEKVPFFLLSIASCALTLMAHAQWNAVAGTDQLPLMPRLETSIFAYAWYVYKTFLPTGLAAFYPHPGIDGISGFQIALAIILIVVITAAALVWRKKNPPLLVGWLWYLGTLVPVVGFVHVGAQLVADRYTYLPSIGLFMAIVWTLSRLGFGRVHIQRIGAATALLVLVVLATMTYRQISFWQNDQILHQRMLAVTENNFKGHHGMALFAGRNGDDQTAEKHYRQALTLSPHDPRINYDYGAFLLDRDRLEESQKHLQTAIQMDGCLDKAHNNLAVIFSLQGNEQQALAQYHKAVEINPCSLAALQNLARNRIASKDYATAAQFYHRAADCAPAAQKTKLRLDYAGAQLSAGQVPAAVLAIENVLAKEPANTRGRYLLGNALMLMRMYVQAEQQYRLSLKGNGNDIHTLNNLGLSLKHQGKRKEAIAVFEKILDRRPQHPTALKNLSELNPNKAKP